MKADLHTHTHCSDGALAPQALVDLAVEAGVDMLAITDHDTLAAHHTALDSRGLRLVPGLELSARWNALEIHVVGLDVDPASPVLASAVTAQRAARAERAQRIAAALVKARLPDLYPAACALAGHEAPGRPHFATAMVDAGLVKDTKQAFKRWLSRGKRGAVATDWADLATTVEWIRAAGGQSVLAHPGRYGLNRARLIRLVDAFAEANGQALEVVSGRQDPSTTRQLASFANERGLLASTGTDFHRPDQVWLKLGTQSPLPPDTTPVWTAFGAERAPAG